MSDYHEPPTYVWTPCITCRKEVHTTEFMASGNKVECDECRAPRRRLIRIQELKMQIKKAQEELKGLEP